MDYRVYHITVTGGLCAGGIYLLMLFCTAMLFYNTPAAMVPLAVTVVPAFRWYRRGEVRKQSRQLLEEFRYCMNSMISSLQAGYALENTFSIAERDLRRRFPGKCFMADECRQICLRSQFREPVEEGLMDLARRSGLEEIRQFAEVVSITGRSGGDLVRVLKRSVSQISESIRTDQEIRVLTASKKLEERVMIVMPFLIIGYMKLTSGGYMDPVYSTMTGRLVMTAALLAIVLSVWMAERITDIRV